MTATKFFTTMALGLILVAGPVGLGGTVAASADKQKADKVQVQQRDMQLLREEEKLARDVYITLNKRWKLPIFDRISQAEQRHLDQMAGLLARHQVADPVNTDQVGVFTNKTLGALYDELVARGSKSVVDALLVGATIEDLDIHDIRDMRNNTTDLDTLRVYAKLECGSRNHIRAFTRQLANKGRSYQAQHLSESELQKILESGHERCGMGQGPKHGRGKGAGCHHEI